MSDVSAAHCGNRLSTTSAGRATHADLVRVRARVRVCRVRVRVRAKARVRVKPTRSSAVRAAQARCTAESCLARGRV